MKKTITISREKLYDQVWSKPLIHLAKEYELSNVGLAKICRRHNVPLPPAGYWLMLAHGRNVKKSPLPPLNQGEVDNIKIVSKELTLLNEMNRSGTITDNIINAIGHSFIAVNEFKTKYHPLVVESQREFRERLKLYNKLQEGERVYIHNIAVTKSSFDRAISLMNNLFQLLELNGLRITRKPGYNGGTYVKTNGVDIRLALKERTGRSENPDPKSFSKYQFHPTGILYFEIEDFYVDGARKIWSDTQSRRLEDVLNEVGIGVVVAAILQKKHDNELEEDRHKEEAERKIRQLKEEQQRKEQQKISALFENAQLWHTCNILRAYIKAVGDKHFSVTTIVEEREELEEWIRWALEKADIIDPVLNQSWKHHSV